MKILLTLLCLFLPAGFAVISASEESYEKTNCGSCMMMLDDHVRMDKLFTPVRYELIYSGVEEGKVIFKHNEYLCDEHGFVKSTGHSHSISLDLNKSRVMDYKGMKIEILNADSKELKYRILPGSIKPERAAFVKP